MAKGFKHGGGTSLNFLIRTYPSETELKADKPKENTIGLITTTTMTSWVFSATEPTEPEVGMVWICIGGSSSIDFNAITHNELRVYPMSAMQYVSGVFTLVTAFSYRNGEWVDWWDGSLYDHGDEFVGITGGWVSETVFGTFTVEKNSDHIYCTAKEVSTGTGGTLRTKNKIPIKHSTLTLLYDATRIANDTILCLSDSEDFSDIACQVSLTKGTDLTTQLDVSGIAGMYYVGILQYTNNGTTTVAVYKANLT